MLNLFRVILAVAIVVAVWGYFKVQAVDVDHETITQSKAMIIWAMSCYLGAVTAVTSLLILVCGNWSKKS